MNDGLGEGFVANNEIVYNEQWWRWYRVDGRCLGELELVLGLMEMLKPEQSSRFGILKLRTDEIC